MYMYMYMYMYVHNILVHAVKQSSLTIDQLCILLMHLHIQCRDCYITD